MSNVNLIALSKPSSITDCNTAEELIAYAARVSNPANQNNKKTSKGLVRYLIRENHWSPLEMVHMTMEITTTRDIARQIIRHRSFAFQEFSQRYASPEEGAVHFKDARLQDDKNRQNSIETQNLDLHRDWRKQQEEVVLKSREAYNWAIKASQRALRQRAHTQFFRKVTAQPLTDRQSLQSRQTRFVHHRHPTYRQNTAG